MPIIDESNAVKLVYHRSSCKLDVSLHGKTTTVSTVSTKGEDETQENGPTPLSSYIVDKHQIHDDHRIDWFNLHQKMPPQEGNGYYGYGQTWNSRLDHGVRRNGMGLHPGIISYGCVTVVKSQWQMIIDMLKQGDLSYIGSNGKPQSFAGTLTIIDN
ncbi:hypothetical protein K7432_011358 [Basidiobolus ranarum]|uniref:YkuD domain-containing protein n=1 Tax=Basidiobolus ranarum TaxID=34480 RepID=A0ABR2WMF6_9FUNG